MRCLNTFLGLEHNLRFIIPSDTTETTEHLYKKTRNAPVTFSAPLNPSWAKARRYNRTRVQT